MLEFQNLHHERHFFEVARKKMLKIIIITTVVYNLMKFCAHKLLLVMCV